MGYFEVLATVSGRAGSANVGTISGLSFCASSATESGLMAPNSIPIDIGAGISAVNSISGRETTSCRVYGSGIGGTSAFPYVQPKYHGGGCFCATDVGRTCRYGRRL